jgi:hypothetical protein
MGRPRKPNRMSRVITARLGDEQYDWLVERAIDEEGDLSKALRDAVDAARVFYALVMTADPPEALREHLKQGEEERAREEMELED